MLTLGSLITPEQFFDLDEQEQIEAVWDGVPVAERLEGDCHVLLYHIGDLYVEALYNLEDEFIRKFEALQIWSCWIFILIRYH